MFKRRFSQKPAPELITSFKQAFPKLADNRRDSLLATPEGKPLNTGLMSFDPKHFEHVEETQENGNTTHAFDASRPTSQAGGNAFSYSSFFDFQSSPQWQQTPNSAGYYNSHTQFDWTGATQSGTLTPFTRSLSLPSPGQSHHPAFLSLQDVQLQPSYQANPFDYSHLSSLPSQHAPTSFNPNYTNLGHVTGLLPSQQQMTPPMYQQTGAESQFRFQVSLLNSTAMVKENEIPVSYLNKRQTYKISIQDTRPDRHLGTPTTYRTYIRISFHEDKQRAQPDQHWQLWKEGRGMNELHQHGGKLQAIEFVPQPAAPGQHTHVHVEKTSIDGFSLTWNVPPGHRPQCEVQFRCNFLSTDFSRSKGVKGIPVRLCAKNEVVGFSQAMGPPPSEPEVSYCKIKLFRDHGAERKLTNDESAIKRAIKKIEDGQRDTPGDEVDDEEDLVPIGSSNKRKAGDISPLVRRPSKISKHKRATSVSSDGSSQGQIIGEGDASQKLITLNQLLRSRLDYTSFSLRGEDLDDPDLCPVELNDKTTRPTSDSPTDLKRVARTNTGLSSGSQDSTYPVSSTPRRQTYLQIPTPVTSQNNSEEWQTGAKVKTEADSFVANPQQLGSPPDQKPVTHVDLGPGRSIRAVDFDPNYVPPSAPQVKPVACFYVKLSTGDESSNHTDLYRACYLYERTADAFVSTIARKANINPHDLVEISYVKTPSDWELQVGIDNDLVFHIPEGHDMTAEFTTATGYVGTHPGHPPRYNLKIRSRT